MTGKGGGRRLPPWLRVRFPAGEAFDRTAGAIAGEGLRTVCREARCPNIGECWGRGEATFLVLGDRCTRSCRFCSVGGGEPLPPEADEPARLARAAARLGLRHVVVTSVTRDDLPDGGASHFAAVARAIREALPGAGIELLVPDFNGDAAALDTVLAAPVDVLAHNVETVPRLYPTLRSRADYRRSLGLLARASASSRARVKSGLMLGLGEERDELMAALADMREAGCSILALGQYLKPSPRAVPVSRFLEPAEFAELEATARGIGFAHVESGPLVRSSYRAGRAAAAAPAGRKGEATG